MNLNASWNNINGVNVYTLNFGNFKYESNSCGVLWMLIALICLGIVFNFIATLVISLILIFRLILQATAEHCKSSTIGIYIIIALVDIIASSKHDVNKHDYKNLTNDMIAILDDHMNKEEIITWTCSIKIPLFIFMVLWGFYEVTNTCMVENMDKLFFIVNVMIIINYFVMLFNELFGHGGNPFCRKTIHMRYCTRIPTIHGHVVNSSSESSHVISPVADSTKINKNTRKSRTQHSESNQNTCLTQPLSNVHHMDSFF